MPDAIELKVEDRAIHELLTKVSHKCKDKRPLMRNIAGIMKDEVEQNFEQEGRPTQWEKSKRAEKEGGKTLHKSGQLAKISADSDNDKSVVGSNKIYAAAQHYGVDKTVNVKQHTTKVKSRDVKSGKKIIAKGIGTSKAHTRHMKIPARPFMIITDGGKEKIKDAARDYLLKD